MQAKQGERSTTRALLDRLFGEGERSARVYLWLGILSSVVLAVATLGTTWSSYQAAQWGGMRTAHTREAALATFKAAQAADLAQQKISLHATLFAQWAGAVSTDNRRLADFLLARFPEPLKAATIAWQATQPLTNPDAPATPFAMPAYALPEQAEAARWEAVVAEELAAASVADEVSDSYVRFTIIFASVLFLGGLSGKWRRQALDVGLLALGMLVLVVALVTLATSPLA